MKTALGTVLLVAALAGLYYLNDATRSEDGASVLHVADELPIDVEVAAAQQRDIVRVVQAPGEVEAISKVEISAEVVAKILEMPVEEGDRVKKGDLLCRLDDVDYRARVASAQAGVARLKATITQANADLEKARRDVQRQIRLSEVEATSELELADYHTILVRARASVEIRRQELIESEERLKSVRKDLEKTIITSPIDGVVSLRFAKKGEVVVMGTMNNPGTRIMIISDLSRMQVRCRVDESDASLVRPGQVALVYLQSDTQESIIGQVLRVATQGTKPPGRDVVTFETLVLVDADELRVKPGMTANVEIEVARSENALTIPVQAVVHRKRRDLPEALLEQAEKFRSKDSTHRRRAAEYLKIVFCIEEEVARPRFVVTGISDESGVEIVSGMTPGQQIVVGPYRSLDQLKDGSRIKVEEEDDKKEKEAQEDSDVPQSASTSETQTASDMKAEEPS